MALLRARAAAEKLGVGRRCYCNREVHGGDDRAPHVACPGAATLCCRSRESVLMTIAKRLVLLLAVPLLALVALGVFTRLQLTTIETRSRFVADLQIPSLAALGNISRTFAELRVHVRNHVLATSEAERASVRSAFERDEAELGRLLDRLRAQPDLRRPGSPPAERLSQRSTGTGWTGRSRSCRWRPRDAVKKPASCCETRRPWTWASG